MNHLELERVVFRAQLESADLVSDSETIHGEVSLILPQCHPMMDRWPWVLQCFSPGDRAGGRAKITLQRQQLNTP